MSTLLDIKKIAERTRELIITNKGDWPDIPAVDEDHCVHLLEKIIREEVYGEQAHRFVGWVQAACCVAGIATMEEFRTLNRDCPKLMQIGFEREMLTMLLGLEKEKRS